MAAVDEADEFLAQPCGQRAVEGDEGLIEQQEVGLDREGARQRHPPCQSERQLAGIVAAMSGEAERLEQRIERAVARQRRGEPHVLLDRAPRQQPRLLKYHAERAVSRQLHRAIVGLVQSRDDAQQRGLAAAGGADERGHFAGAQAERERAQHIALAPRRRGKGFVLDGDIKPVAGANGRHVVQAAAPGTFR